ncbi:hypothetical protein OESDEN_19086 [Oesophagostomum dentatum]|uniref:Uncharacterized protein n=1 Tax=Oesophagostomum dentatum TaxID=61180 RepID=A0A0B1S7F7_OESDE|nr:hypothetical protein OESDEN_19086 [Oesophagostomum dentatum]
MVSHHFPGRCAYWLLLVRHLTGVHCRRNSILRQEEWSCGSDM